MGKGFGIAAFVVLLLSLPIPVLGNYLTFLALILLCAAAYARETAWTIAVDVIAWVKMFFLSPTWHVMMFSSSYMRGTKDALQSMGPIDRQTSAGMDSTINAASGTNMGVLLFTLAMLAAPIAVLVLRAASKPTAQPGSAG